MKLTKEILNKILRSVQMTSAQELGCGECYEQLDQFAELKLKGKTPEAAMPLVQEHLNKCKDCHEEYKALLAALRALEKPM